MSVFTIKHQTSLALMAVVTGALLMGCGGQEDTAHIESVEQNAIDDAPILADLKEDERLAVLADTHAGLILQMSPEAATRLGVTEEMGGADYNARLSTYSPLGQSQAMALNDRMHQDLQMIDYSQLTTSSQLTYDILAYGYEAAARRNQFQFGNATPIGYSSPYALSQLSGPHINLPRLLLTQHPLRTAKDAEHYVARLSELARGLAETQETLLLDAGNNVVPPLFALEGAVSSIEGLTQTPPAEHVLIRHFTEKLDAITTLETEIREELLVKAILTVESEIYPAYQNLAATLTDLKEAAGPDAGIWRLEDGKAYYQLALDAYGA
ncbi:MAG: DUF885 family protein, partial [Pseudomonadota bacterium]